MITRQDNEDLFNLIRVTELHVKLSLQIIITGSFIYRRKEGSNGERQREIRR